VTADDVRRRERQLLEAAVVRLRSRVMALVFAMVGGSGLFVATVWLLLRGGHNVGMHLGLLENYFPGYDVTWSGSLVGFAYGALVGAALGWSVAWVYNRVADRRNPA
jgi:hypothetical protein